MNIKELVVYLSGPISGREDREAITHFASVENILDPHHIVFNPTLTPKRYMGGVHERGHLCVD